MAEQTTETPVEATTTEAVDVTTETTQEVDATTIQAELETARAELEAIRQSEEKWKARAKRGKKKAKEMMAQQDEPETNEHSNDSDDDYDFTSEDKLSKLEEFVKVSEFKEVFPEVSPTELSEVKKISNSKGLSYEDAYKIYKFEIMNDPQKKNLSEAKRSSLDGNFTRPPAEADSQLKRRQELAKQR